MITDLGRKARQWAANEYPWTNVYGVARSLLALGTGITFLFNSPDVLFHPVLGSTTGPPFHSDPLFEMGFFYLFGANNLGVALWCAIAILIVVASGWRPRFTGIIHWWISWSFYANASIVDGGDQITTNLTLLLIPLTLTDNRRWHWQQEKVKKHLPPEGSEEIRRIFALWSLLLIRIQVAVVYFHASIAKFGIQEWADGTASYYWLSHPIFGVSFVSLMDPILSQGVFVTVMTWGTMIIEYSLSLGIVLPKRYRGTLLVFGVALHIAIIVFHGLVSFSIAMFAALILYLRPFGSPFTNIIPRKFDSPGEHGESLSAVSESNTLKTLSLHKNL